MSIAKPAAAGFLQGDSLLRPATVGRALSAVLSRGDSYEPTPQGAFLCHDQISGYYLDFRAKTSSSTAPERLLPAALAQLGLGWWEHGVGGEPAAFDRALEVSKLLIERASSDDGNLVWLHDVPVPKYGLHGRYTSALAQGQAASLLVRAHLRSGDKQLADLARRAIDPLLDASSDLVTVTSAGMVLEEIPSRPPSHILNGWISALWGLRDVGEGLAYARALAGFDDGCRALAQFLRRYDVGWWSRYSLYPTSVADLAKPIYHRLHIDQLEVLHRITGDRLYLETARRWRSYDTAARRLRMLVQKGRFVVAFSRGTLCTGSDELQGT